jgi:hypothetical protein
MRNNSSALRLARLAEARPEPDPPAPEAAHQSRFDIAAARAMVRYTPAEWALLEPSRRTASIYTELRRLDAEWSGLPARPRTRL